MKKLLVIFLSGLLIGLLLSLGATHYLIKPKTVERVDTVYRYTPKLIIDPIPTSDIEVEKISIPKYSFSEIVDTVTNTVYVQVPITQKYYHSSNEYDAWVSGFNPKLDSIKLYNKETVITKTKVTAPRFIASVGLQYNYYLKTKSEVRFTFDASYNFNKFTVTPELGVLWNCRGVDSYLGCKLKYNLYAK